MPRKLPAPPKCPRAAKPALSFSPDTPAGRVTGGAVSGSRYPSPCPSSRSAARGSSFGVRVCPRRGCCATTLTARDGSRRRRRTRCSPAMSTWASIPSSDIHNRGTAFLPRGAWLVIPAHYDEMTDGITEHAPGEDIGGEMRLQGKAGTADERGHPISQPWDPMVAPMSGAGAEIGRPRRGAKIAS